MSPRDHIMQTSERDAWLHIVKPAELDLHMAAVGQAEANGEIVREMFKRFPANAEDRLLVHGCGSCQMFDYLDFQEFGGASVTFADISPLMLAEANRRLARFHEADYDITLDDIENSKLVDAFDGIILVLVLLHVDWRKSLANMMGYLASGGRA